MKPRPARAAALAAVSLAAYAALAGLPRSSSAADEDGGAAAAPPAELADALEQTDPKGVMAVKLPRDWKVIKRDHPRTGELAAFSGKYTDVHAGEVWLSVDPTTPRAAVSLWTTLRNGRMLPEHARSGPGWAEGCLLDEANDPPIAVFARCVEKDGQVYVARVLCHKNSIEVVKEIAPKILASVQVKGTHARPGLPKGWKEKKAGDFDVWTDSDDMAKATRPAPLVAEAREVLTKALKGKPFDESRPVVKAFQNAAKFADETKEMYGEEQRFAAWDPNSRSVMLELMSSETIDFPGTVRNNAARQYLVQYFGGEPPLWVLLGMQLYGAAGAEAGGKPQDPPKAWIQRGRTAGMNGKRRFDEWLNSRGGSDVPDLKAAADELFAWHFYFRHGPGKKHKKVYEASFEALRATGDPLAAAKAWDGTDFDALTKEFRTWASKWEP